MIMRRQLGIRSTLAVVAFAAVVCGWYAWNASERQDEIAVIEKLGSVASHGVVVNDGVHPFDGCGTWSGVIVHLETRGPSILNVLNIDALKRVIRVDVQNETNPEILSVLEGFSHMEEAFFDNGPIFPVNAFYPEDIEYVNAIRDFSAANSHVDVQVWELEAPSSWARFSN